MDKWQVELENATNRLAFFLHASIVNKNAEEVLPAYWSDNFVSLAPGASTTLEVSIRDAAHNDAPLYLQLKGLNVQNQTVTITSY